MSPKVSFIVPVYKVEPYLRACLESIRNQSLTDYEVIIVNDESPDRSRDIALEFCELDPRFTLIDIQHGGLSMARNAGLERVCGEFFLFVDSDDWIDSHLAEKVYQYAVENGCDLVMFGFVEIKDGDPNQRTPYVTDTALFDGSSDFWERAPHWTIACNKLYRTSTHAGVRFPPGKIHEDEFVFHEYIHLSATIGVVGEILYFYRIRPGSLMSTLDNKAAVDAVDALVGRVLFFNEHDALRSYVEHEFRAVVYWFLNHVRRSSGDATFIKSGKMHLFRLRYLPFTAISTPRLRFILFLLKVHCFPARFLASIKE